MKYYYTPVRMYIYNKGESPVVFYHALLLIERQEHHTLTYLLHRLKRFDGNRPACLQNIDYGGYSWLMGINKGALLYETGDLIIDARPIKITSLEYKDVKKDFSDLCKILDAIGANNEDNDCASTI